MTEKFDGFQVLVAAIAVCNPLAVFASIVQVQHGCNGIYTQSVYMELLNPVKCVSDQEVGNLVLFIIKDLGTPVRMLALARVCVLEERLSVKIREAVGIAREVGRNPVQNDTDAFFVHVVYEIFELFRGAVAGGRSVVAGYLVAPGTIVRMLRNAHQFYMGVTHLFHISGKLCGSFFIGIVAILFWSVFLFPGT